MIVVVYEGMVIGPFDNAEQAEAFAYRNRLNGYAVVTVLPPVDGHDAREGAR